MTYKSHYFRILSTLFMCFAYKSVKKHLVSAYAIAIEF